MARVQCCALLEPVAIDNAAYKPEIVNKDFTGAGRTSETAPHRVWISLLTGKQNIPWRPHPIEKGRLTGLVCPHVQTDNIGSGCVKLGDIGCWNIAEVLSLSFNGEIWHPSGAWTMPRIVRHFKLNREPHLWRSFNPNPSAFGHFKLLLRGLRTCQGCVRAVFVGIRLDAGGVRIAEETDKRSDLYYDGRKFKAYAIVAFGVTLIACGWCCLGWEGHLD